MQRMVIGYIMCNEQLCQDFWVHSMDISRNNVLVKLRDVKFDDASILFLFSAKFSLSIVSSQTHFYF